MPHIFSEFLWLPKKEMDLPPSLRRDNQYASLALLCTLILSAAAFGQTTTATLTGTVLDQSASAIPGANVTLTNDQSGDVRRTVTNNEGYYGVSPIPPGPIH